MHSNKNSTLRGVIANLAVVILLGFSLIGLIFWQVERIGDKADRTVSTSTTKKTSAKKSFDKTKYSINDPTSLWVVVNKGRGLSSSFAPSNLVVPKVKNHYGNSSNDSHLRSEASDALVSMFDAASKQGLNLILYSGYRSYSEQASVNSNFASSIGQSATDQSSARAGHSEHQTGLAADISSSDGKCDIDQCFENTSAGKWLASNAYQYGFILRYPKDKQNLTGYEYEPWHFRYVGVDLAEEINKTGQTLEQFFDLPNFTDYPATSYELKS